MLKERVEVVVSPTEAESAPKDDCAEVLKLLARLEASHDEAIATSFNRAVVALARRPSASVFELLSEKAGRPWLAQVRDAQGWPCRAAVLSAWADLGYPWALELSAEELAYVRENALGSAGGWLKLTFVLAAISAVHNSAALFFIIVATFALSFDGLALIFAVPPFAGMLVHALATVAATRAAQARPSFAAGRLKALSRAGWLVVGLAMLLGLSSVPTGVALFVVGLPLLVSSASAAVASSGLLKR